MSEKICITTNNTGIAHYIDDGRNGFLVEYGDTDALTQRMEQIIADQYGMQKYERGSKRNV